MKQRITDERAKAEVICGTSRECRVCPMYEKHCKGIDGIYPDVYADLLDARSLLKEAEEVIKEAYFVRGTDNVSAETFLAKLKEYAERASN